MATRHDMPEEEESVWRIVIPIPNPKEQVRIFPPHEPTRLEIERRLGEGEDLMDILTDPDGNISF